MRHSARILLAFPWLRARRAQRGPLVLVAQADMTSCDRVHELFDQCRRMLRKGARHLVIDLHQVQSADTKLLACIVALYQMARSSSARLEVCLSGVVLELARICRMEWLAEELAGDRRDHRAAQ